MNEEQLIEFLKKNLKVVTKVKSDSTGDKMIEVTLILSEEKLYDYDLENVEYKDKFTYLDSSQCWLYF